MEQTAGACARVWSFILAAVVASLFFHSPAGAVTLNVQSSNGGTVGSYRWVVQEDTTHEVVLNTPTSDSLSWSIHKRHAAVVASGRSSDLAPVTNLDPGKRYFISVLPDAGYTMGGGAVATGQASLTITVNPHPVPSAQMRVFVFEDNRAISGAPEIPAERGLQGFHIHLHDVLGHQAFDVFGKPLGTTYHQTGGVFDVDTEGNPVVETLGNLITTGPDGRVLIKNLAPGLYNVTATPGDGQDWIPTTSIIGGPAFPVVVQAGEPPLFIQGGLLNDHAFFGFVKPFRTLPNGTGTITGRCLYESGVRPPATQTYPGAPVPNCYVGINTVEQGTEVGVLAQAADPVTGEFTITNVPAGTMQVTTWDRGLTTVISIRTVTLGAGEMVAMGDITTAAWQSKLEGTVFRDTNENGFRDSGEVGIPNQGLDLRTGDGVVLATGTTNGDGEYSFSFVPFDTWLVHGVDYADDKVTGATFTADYGGPLGQTQPPRTELPPPAVLLEGVYGAAGQTNVADWGKTQYGPGLDGQFGTSDDENGGIVGITFNEITRAEDDPQFAAGEPWDVGIPRVQVNLYLDADDDRTIDDVNGDAVASLADVDNYPLQWTDPSAPGFTGAPGPEDIDGGPQRIYPTQTAGVFDAGDAINIAWTDSFDDRAPTGCGTCRLAGTPCSTTAGDCIGGDTCTAETTVHGGPIQDCSETGNTWNQMRPAVFDGGYAFETYVPGGVDSGNPEERLPSNVYIVETTIPAGYELHKEEDKNIDFGDPFIPTPTLLPPRCVGDPHTVPPFMSMDGTTPVSRFAGETRRLCDRKQVTLTSGQNVNCDFDLFTFVPVAGRLVGTVVNINAPQTNPNAPNFGPGGFFSPPFVPVSIRDYNLNEIARVYTDEFGKYNALVPSTWNINVPAPSGVGPGVVTVCPNDPGPVDLGAGPVIDPQYKPQFDHVCLPFQVMPGQTTYAFTPVSAISSVVAATTPVDCEFPDGTPVVTEASGPGSSGPYVTAVGATVTLTSLGTVSIGNPEPPPAPATISRDFGFGASQGTGEVTVAGVSVPITSWSDATIEFTIPAGLATGQLVVTRDNGRSSRTGITLHVDIGGALSPTYVSPGGSIQDALDGAAANDLILVRPGIYQENLILSKPVRLQGFGAGSTTIDASTFDEIDNRAAWHTRLDTLINSGAIDLVPGQRADFLQEDGAGITVVGKATGPNAFTGSPRALIDGFTITGAIRGGGVFVNGNAPYLEISNNRMQTNQGTYGGAVRVGWINLVNDSLTGYFGSNNHDLLIHHDQLIKNGSLLDGGGVGLFKGADDYVVTDNWICGNYAAANGAGISHFGLSPHGTIGRNFIIFNEAFGEGAAVAVTGQFAPNGGPSGFLTEGTGSVRIDANLMQGNLAGDDGGAVSIFSPHGLDVSENPGNPATWHQLDITNNRIVNNIAAFSGAGIALADCIGAKVNIVHNLIAHNDVTSLATFALGPTLQSSPQGSGIVARSNSPELTALSGQSFCSPTLVNDIIYKNRTFIWDANENGGLGGIIPDPVSPFWDLEVLGQPSGTIMHPEFCVLTSLSDPHSTATYSPTNMAADPELVDPYFTTLEVTPARLAPSFSPRTLTGDYAIVLASPAVDAGSSGILGSFGSALSTDFGGQVRPSGPGIDIGADEVQQVVGGPGGGGGSDTIGPTVRSLSAAPNPTNGAASVTITATAYDTGTGGSVIAGAELFLGGLDPGAGNGTSMSSADGVFDEVTEGVTRLITVPGTTNFTVSVRAQDADGNWGPVSVVLVRRTTTPTGDVQGPSLANLTATPNPTNGSISLTLTGTAFDNFTGGSSIAAAEWWTGIDPGQGNGFPMAAVDTAFNSVEEIVTATAAVQPSDFTVFARSKDGAGNWGTPVSVAVTVTGPDSGTGQGVHVQCPGDADGDAVIDAAVDPHAGDVGAYSFPSDARCKHLAAGDGFVNMADGRRLYTFGFSDLTGVSPDQAVSRGNLAANFPAPSIIVDEDDEFHLNLTNVTMQMRQDLFDPHTVHWHGFPNAAPIFDGLPDASIAIGMGNTLAYYYNVKLPGTYMYHCHVEATEHMQMGMLGNLYVRPKQNRLPHDYCFATRQVEAHGSCAGWQHSNPDWDVDRNRDDPLIGDTYAYNDGDGTTDYDVEHAIQIGAFDPDFHDMSEGIQPLPFALMNDRYPMLNGRGYPDTINPAELQNTADDPKFSQKQPTLIQATRGQKILLRISNLNVMRFYTLATLGVPMRVVGIDARLLRGAGGQNLYYTTNSVTLGGGQSVDVILDTTNVEAGTYPLYTTNLNYLSNNEEDFGGMMSEIIITNP